MNPTITVGVFFGRAVSLDVAADATPAASDGGPLAAMAGGRAASDAAPLAADATGCATRQGMQVAAAADPTACHRYGCGPERRQAERERGQREQDDMLDLLHCGAVSFLYRCTRTACS